ncbi:helix-turn-helix domain-containing protein [Neisseria lactamica]|uniref:transcriptional regulator n=1 Tax=Neisseria lactamica TaxID=486 RepID=UPI000E598DFB|nr:transcriptional regulator [Neisseria lactamica]
MENSQAIDYERKLNRAKEILNAQTDKDFAELIGINPKTFSRKRRRFEFPETELRAFANKNNLSIDWNYLMTGELIRLGAAIEHLPKLGESISGISGGRLKEDEQELLTLFREAAAADREMILMVARRAEKKAQAAPGKVSNG